MTATTSPLIRCQCRRKIAGGRASTWRGYGGLVNKHGGNVTVVHLPEIGIRGNTHFPFSDLKNVEIADQVSKFLTEKGLDLTCRCATLLIRRAGSGKPERSRPDRHHPRASGKGVPAPLRHPTRPWEINSESLRGSSLAAACLLAAEASTTAQAQAPAQSAPATQPTRAQQPDEKVFASRDWQRHIISHTMFIRRWFGSVTRARREPRSLINIGVTFALQ